MKNQLDSTNLRNQIYDIILGMIVRREIKPGEKIYEEQIAKQIGVSRTPIRETLCSLENDGIIKNIPRRGAFVNKLSRETIIEILQIREVLEGLIVRVITPSLGTKTLQKLKRCLDKIDAVPDDATNHLKFTQADREFHDLLLGAYKNKILKNMMKVVEAHLQIIRLRTVVIPGRAKRTVQEHKDILKAIEEKNAEQAEILMKRHIKSVRDAAVEHMEAM